MKKVILLVAVLLFTATLTMSFVVNGDNNNKTEPSTTVEKVETTPIVTVLTLEEAGLKCDPNHCHIYPDCYDTSCYPYICSMPTCGIRECNDNDNNFSDYQNYMYLDTGTDSVNN